MRFADPIWLVLGAISVVALLVLMLRAERKTTRALALLAGARMRPAHAATVSPLRRRLRVAVTAFAVAMGFCALARPQKGMHWETVERKGVDLLLLVDTSKSMDADDVKPTRLQRVKLAIADLVGKFPGDRVGLVAFAGDAVVHSPMTLDHGALLETVDALDTSSIARAGTDIGRAIDVGARALVAEAGHQREMVLLTDGEDLEGRGLAEASKAAAADITIDTVGVGSPEGDLVPAKDERGRVVGVVRDENGTPVRSRLDEAGLRAIANAGHGSYQPFGVDGLGLDRLYQDSLAARAHVEAASRTRRVYSERFEVPLGLALFALLLDALLGLPRRRQAWLARTLSPAAAATALVLLLAPGAHASVSGAASDYAAGRFAQAADEYQAQSSKHPQDARLAFNAGDAAYRAKRYDAAVAAFTRALQAPEPKLKQHVLYNQGDALYRAGAAHPAAERVQTLEQWKAAIAAYEGALALDPKDADARFNRDYVQRKLAQLEQQQKQEQQKKQEQEQQAKDQAKPKDSGASQPAQQGQGKNDKGADGQGQASKADPGSGAKPAPQSAAKPSAEPGQSAARDEAKSQGAADNAEQNAAQAGRLSPDAARGLLEALRGEERHAAVRGGAAAGAAEDDTPRKDW